MAGAILVSTFGCANGLTLAGARVYYAMSRDGLFFKSVGKLQSASLMTPVAGLLVQAVVGHRSVSSQALTANCSTTSSLRCCCSTS